MKKYQFTIQSNRIYIISFIIFIPIFMSVLELLGKYLLFGWLFLLLFGIGLGFLYLASKLSSAKILIELSEEGYKHIWIKRFMFSKEKDIELKWDDIVDYSFERFRGWYRFQLTLENKKCYKFNKFDLFNRKDDFYMFNIEFLEYINKINKDKDETINVGKTIYEETLFMVFMLVVTGVIIYQIYDINQHTNWFLILIMTVVDIIYWNRIYRIYKSRRNKL